MTPGDEFVRTVNKALADPNVRESVRQMHAENTPLTKMVEALGLEDDMSRRIGDILNGLAPDVVEGIRRATLSMLDSGTYVMPLDCGVSAVELNGGAPIAIDVTNSDEVPTIHIRSTSTV